ncbi:MAG: anthranilate phosphoribosyltransferase [Oligoflexia bacterium]|nr:anthranilate phosphoribosyltransferase [Oligoflexia bacterium]
MENIETKYLQKLTEHYSLSTGESEELMLKFLSGDFNPRIAASILSIITFKGENVEELTGFALALREKMKKFNTPHENLIDIVGTGSSKKNTFNISTIASLLISSLGVMVSKEIKHDRSSDCGNADLLKALGVNLEANYEQKKHCMESENFIFVNVDEYYPAMDPIKKIEAELNISSILSLLPPLCHPSQLERIIIGTRDRTRASLISQALENLGTDKAYVLWNEEGYDELVPIGTTKVIVVGKSEKKRELSLTANDFALAGNYKSGTPIPGGDLQANMGIIEEINNCTPGIVLDTVIMNAVLGLRLAGVINSLKEGTELIKAKLKEQPLKAKIAGLVKATNAV